MTNSHMNLVLLMFLLVASVLSAVAITSRRTEGTASDTASRTDSAPLKMLLLVAMVDAMEAKVEA